MGLLNIYKISLNQPSGYYKRPLNALDPDLSTEYPNTITGTPTNTQNPGGPPQNFDQHYDSGNTYLNNVYSGELQNTLDITNLDVENPGVQGGPAKAANDPTNYPSLTTGTPTTNANPGGPTQKFNQIWLPNKSYLDSNTIAGTESGILRTILPITNLDVEDPGVQGGPAKTINDPTNYPSLTTGTPTTTANPGGPTQKFNQTWLPNKSYLDSNPIAGLNSGKLDDTLPITNLDVENPNVQGGPLNDTVTVYPESNVYHTSPITGWFAKSSTPPANFTHSFTPTKTYKDYIQNYI